MAEHLERPFTHAVLKGRANYLCLQRLDEASRDDQLGFEGMETLPEQAVTALPVWTESTETGDRRPSGRAASAGLGLGQRDVPGVPRRHAVPRGGGALAERARERAASADVVVVNTHLYGLDMAAEGALLPDHDVVASTRPTSSRTSSPPPRASSSAPPGSRPWRPPPAGSPSKPTS